MSNWLEDLKALLATIDSVADAIKAVTDALPDAGALNDLATLEARLTAVRAGYLDQLDFDLQGLLNSIVAYLSTEIADILADVTGINGDAMRGTDNAALAASWTAALATALGNYTAARAGYLDELDFALQEAIAALQTDLDNPAQYKADLSTLETRLSAARAGYLDQLDFNLQEAIAAIPTTMVGTNNAALAANWTAALATALGNYTAVRAGYLDELAAANIPADVDEIKALVDSAESVGPFSYLDAGGEQDVVEDTATTRRRIWLDFSNRNMTQTGTFIIYRKVDGANYDVYATQPVLVAAGEDRAFDAEFTTNQAWKLTYEEGADEGAARAIPYNVITQVVE